MKPYVGKIVALGIVTLVLAPILLYLEFQYGFYQKFRFEKQAERYLAATYSEEMRIEDVRYLWDNIEPLVATAYPKSDPSLRFYVHLNEERELGLSDDYAPTLWKRQAIKETESLLKPVQPEYVSHATIEFSCCEVAEYDYSSIRGEVPHYGTTGLPFDLVVDMERPMSAADLVFMYRSTVALRESDTLVLESLTFRFPLRETGRSVVFAIPGGALNAVVSTEDIETYNATRLPAREMAERIGASLKWDEKKSEAVFSHGDTTLVVRSWGHEALLNGIPVEDSLGAYIGDSSELMVPVRLIERAFSRKIGLW